jgi:hypothetical protein
MAVCVVDAVTHHIGIIDHHAHRSFLTFVVGLQKRAPWKRVSTDRLLVE